MDVIPRPPTAKVNLGAEYEVDVVLCVAVGHVFSVGAVILRRRKMCRHLRGSCISGVRVPGAGARPTKGMPRKYVPLSIVTEAFVSFCKSPLRTF